MIWFCMGYAVAFGTDPKLNIPGFVGFTHGWFGDFSGGFSMEGEDAVSQTVYNDALMFNQRRFYVFFAF